ncbi:hypothetical protein [Mesorhizobium sp. M7A.F.Ca.MR.362.00.0.0]|jgi:hypothetical protein|uniref:hypothetical protein n=1 Tax=Mesorhizobium sp. M7A.F.Ca.MR.362.00.0.0 TaxID=2496779 RepID=UPI000FD2009F|nr:hypothetical protein [Mesorhizobium sp. M7A.F.Ca.MR.362.00.0.0]RUU80234.1 hypothetical protein EOC06_12935 [Mesorhizobium sp. M7A.F.Ca.MR.362.00.0.0]RWN95152.1 MAG: hypothetical protein EOS05_10150 [Mesorhizobium sp.]
MIDMDRINNVDAATVAATTLQIIDRVQDDKKEMQVVALAAAFSVFCRRHRVDPSEVFRAASNVLASKFRENPAFVALDMYVENEL